MSELYSREAEEALIGYVLVNPDRFSEVKINLDDFEIQHHRWIWNAIDRLAEAHTEIDNITVANQLESDGHLAGVGGPSYLAKLIQRGSEYYNAPEYAMIIKQRAAKRKKLELATRLAKGEDIIAELETLQAPPETEKTPSRWSVTDLMDTDFPTPQWAIPEIIPAGLTILGGRPKIGKSWLLLQAAWAVGSGGMFLDHKVEKGNSLYIALEDSPRRLKERISAMGIDRHAAITFVNVWRPLHKGGLDDLLLELETNPYRYVAIDTLTRALPGVDQKNDQGVIGEVFDALQKMGQKRNIAIVLADHTRKPAGMAADPIDDILYSTEKTAIADVILAIYKEQGKPGARLLGRGRDIEEIGFSLVFNTPTRCWQLESATITENHEKIIATLVALGRCKADDIAKAIGENRGNTYTRLQKLANEGLITRIEIRGEVFYAPLP